MGLQILHARWSWLTRSPKLLVRLHRPAYVHAHILISPDSQLPLQHQLAAAVFDVTHKKGLSGRCALQSKCAAEVQTALATKKATTKQASTETKGSNDPQVPALPTNKGRHVSC